MLNALIAAWKVTAIRVAEDIGIDPMQVSRLRRGILPVSPRNAALLGRYFGTGTLFWLDLQAKDDAHMIDSDKTIQAEITKITPLKDTSAS